MTELLDVSGILMTGGDNCWLGVTELLDVSGVLMTGSDRTVGCQWCINDRGTTELQEWIDTINLIAASLSSPPLPSGVGSQARFQRPLMPSACTKLGIVSLPFSPPLPLHPLPLHF